MKTFREIAVEESLSYKIKNSDFEKIDFSKYKVTDVKDNVTIYNINGENIFTYNNKTKQLIVLKQGWQLMNVKRGF